MQVNNSSRVTRTDSHAAAWRTRQRSRSGFTLIELIVVVGIIIFLVGLTVTTAASITRQAEHRQTENTLRLLDLAMTEWETESGRKLTWEDHFDAKNAYSTHASSAELHFDTPEILLISELLDVVERVQASRDILRQLDPELTYRYSTDDPASWLSPAERSKVNSEFVGSLTVLDAWGTPIYATHPGRLHDPVDFPYDASRIRDEDGTIRTYNEDKYGVALNRRVCFVSAGPDGEFGYMAENPESPAFKQTLDNVASYQPETP